MRKVLLAASLLCGTACAQEQTGAPAGIALPPAPVVPERAPQMDVATGRAVFRVHVADGRDGSALAGIRVTIWYDEPAGPGYAVTTDARGDAAMPKPVGEPVRVLVKVGGEYVDCRKLDAGTPPQGYSLTAIAEKGLGVENRCGAGVVRTAPGELVVYARSPHWFEKLNSVRY